MAVDSIGIYPNDQGAVVGKSISIHSGDSAPSLKFRFATQSQAWLTANVWVTVDAVRKAGNESINGYANMGADGAVNVARSSFTYVGQTDGLYVYEIALSHSDMSNVASLLGTLTYSSRSYDAIRLTIDVRVVWGAQGESVKGSSVCYIGFKPTYTATGAKYSPLGLEISYTASGWGRPNDRWSNNSITADGEPVAEANAAYGVTDGAGVITIPADRLLYIPETGDILGGTIRMVGSWQETGSSLGLLSLAGVSVTNLTTVRKPTLTVSTAGSGVMVTVGAGTGTGTAATEIDVSMVGGSFNADKVTLAPGDSHFFAAVPAGVATTFQAVGRAYVTNAWFASGPVNETATAVSVEGIDIVTEYGLAVGIPYNATLVCKTSPETETAKLAGRERPTVGYGEGGEAKWSIGGTICADSIGTLTTTDPDDVYRLPFGGVCVIRTQDGKRVQASIKEATVERDEGGHGGLRSVAISAEEVA